MSRTERTEQGGYVAAMTALMLVPLMIMAAFAIDIGSWYSIAASTQTAADAAALSAVAHLPNTNDAVAAAFAEAARNGFVDADGHTQASFDTPTSYPQILVSLPSDFEVQVQIKTEGEALFGRVVFDGIVIERLARAQFIRPVTMRNPTSQLGASHLNDPTDKTGAFWLRVQGYCGIRANGARHFVGFENTRMGCPGTPNNRTYFNSFGFAANNQWQLGAQVANSNIGTLNGATANPNDWYATTNSLRDDYFIAIELSASEAVVPWRVQIYRPGVCTGTHEGYGATNTRVIRPGTGAEANSMTPPRIRTRLFNVDNTLVDRWNAITLGNIKNETYWPRDACAGDAPVAPATAYDGWYTIANIGGLASEQGTHYLSYGSDEVLNEFWMNSFAIRVVPLSSNVPCIGLTDAVVCPSVSAVDDLPIYIDGGNEAGTANIFAANEVVELYLADVPVEHAGKTLRIQLFDPGEGMDNLQILNPSGTPVSFTWFSNACATTGFCGAGGNGADLAGGPNTLCSGVPCLDVTSSRFQNNEVTLLVNLPSSYSCTSCFWKVRYKPGTVATVTDATEWSVAITGDPVRLTD